jgi:hypothetical protein
MGSDTALDIAQQFGDAVVAGDFGTAYLFLTGEARRHNPPVVMSRDVDEMIAYAEEPLVRAEALEESLEHDWPEKQPGDVAWAYVALAGERFVEAVVVVLTQTKDGIRIRELEWGRP